MGTGLFKSPRLLGNRLTLTGWGGTSANTCKALKKCVLFNMFPLNGLAREARLRYVLAMYGGCMYVWRIVINGTRTKVRLEEDQGGVRHEK